MRLPEPRWKAAKPGLERAACVMRPTDPLVKGTHNDYVLAAHIGPLHCIMSRSAVRFPSRAVGLAEPDASGRIISAARVESAVETTDFLAIITDECGNASHDRDGWSTIITAIRDGASLAARNPKRAKTLRGAYIAAHVALDAKFAKHFANVATGGDAA